MSRTKLACSFVASSDCLMLENSFAWRGYKRDCPTFWVSFAGDGAVVKFDDTFAAAVAPVRSVLAVRVGIVGIVVG